MLCSRLHVALFFLTTGALATGFGWQVHQAGELRAAAAEQRTAADASVVSLRQQIAQATARVTAAERRVTELLATAKTASAPRQGTARATPEATTTRDAANALIERGRQLIKDGKQQEALDAYVAFYRELRAIRPGSGESQSIMSAIRHLGRTYPPAVKALGGLRDEATADWKARPTARELPFEIALLNDRLGEGQRTLPVYDALPAGDFGRSGLAMVAFENFVDARRYADALLGRPAGRMLGSFEASTSMIQQRPAPEQTMMREAMIKTALTDIEVLTGAGKAEEARILTEKLLAFDNTEPTRTALQKHLARTKE